MTFMLFSIRLAVLLWWQDCHYVLFTSLDIIDHRLEVAKKLGATYTLNVSKMDPHVAATKVCEIIKDEPDITMECSGVENSIQLGLYVGSFNSIDKIMSIINK